MFKRAAAALLWFYAVVWAFNFISAFTGMPHVFGVLVGVAAAAFVGLDPLGVIWAASTTSDGTEPASVVERFPATKVRVTP
jgi:hypothetical protein